MTVFRWGVIINTVDGTRITKEKRSDGKTIVYNYGADGSLVGFGGLSYFLGGGAMEKIGIPVLLQMFLVGPFIESWINGVPEY